ncbi:Gfo/Idh/MocA family oxidoreductase [Pseudomonas sp. 102515]|uniref:Gfo/Idh/MocA family protein n=1 Tax=Pseudomonas sp. 102515 TaxID=3071568 RepID=UPI00280145A6|nr:Gfo/Idh/MocA family oxidoreductase [Pseudomonas sp. 102515]MDQ7912436.1 Gfo/Idh/MocA family oxidoreductase [Pseudomonas sp. 102515]
MVAALRIALIGAGNMGRQHLHHLQFVPSARLCALADPDPAASELAAQWAVPHFSDHRQLLETVRPDAVVVANPNALHVATALDCLALGIPVLLEKPVGTSPEEVARLLAAQGASQVPLLVGHHRRHNPLIARAHELLREGVLGRLVTVTALWQLQKPASYFDSAWRREAGAGMLLTNLIHDLDLLRHLCGEVRQVQAFADNALRGYANADSAAISLQFESGALGSLTASDGAVAPWSWELTSGENPVYPHQPDQSCYLFAGIEGALSVPQLRLWRYAEPGAGWHQPLATEVRAVAPDEALRLQLEHFVRVARGAEAPLVSAEDAARTLALVAAVERAAASGTAQHPAAPLLD